MHVCDLLLYVRNIILQMFKKWRKLCLLIRLNLDAHPVSSAWTHPQIWFPSLSKRRHTDGSSKDACPTIAICHLHSLFGRCLDRWLHHIGLWRILILLCPNCPAQFTKPAWIFWFPHPCRDCSSVLCIICYVTLPLLSPALETASFRFINLWGRGIDLYVTKLELLDFQNWFMLPEVKKP